MDSSEGLIDLRERHLVRARRSSLERLADGGTRLGVRMPIVGFAATALVGLVTVAIGLGRYSGDYDEGVYWQSLRALDHGHRLFAQVFSSQPPLFLFTVLPLFHAGGSSIAAARAAILCFAAVGLVATFALGRIVDRATGVLAVALLLSSALFVYDAMRLAATLPAVAFSTVGVALAAVVGRMQRRRQLVAAGAGVVLGVATMIKLLGVVAVPPALFLLFSGPWRPTPVTDGHLGVSAPDIARHDRVLARERWYAAVALITGFVIVDVIVFAVFWNHGKFYDQVVRFHLDSRSTWYSEPVTSAGMRDPLLVCGVIAIAVVLVQRARSAYVYVVWLVSGIAFLVMQRPPIEDHLLVLGPPAALIIAGLPSRLGARTTREWTRRVVALGVAVVLVIGLARVVVDATRMHTNPDPFEAALIDAVRRHVAPPELVVTDDQYLSADAGQDVPPDLVDTSYVRIASHYLTATDLIRITDRRASAVLFTGGRFEQLPYFRSWVTSHFELVEDFGRGAALYARHHRTHRDENAAQHRVKKMFAT
jgi:hypothetical protein